MQNVVYVLTLKLNLQEPVSLFVHIYDGDQYICHIKDGPQYFLQKLIICFQYDGRWTILNTPKMY